MRCANCCISACCVLVAALLAFSSYLFSDYPTRIPNYLLIRLTPTSLIDGPLGQIDSLQRELLRRQRYNLIHRDLYAKYNAKLVEQAVRQRTLLRARSLWPRHLPLRLTMASEHDLRMLRDANLRVHDATGRLIAHFEARESFALDHLAMIYWRDPSIIVPNESIDDSGLRLQIQCTGRGGGVIYDAPSELSISLVDFSSDELMRPCRDDLSKWLRVKVYPGEDSSYVVFRCEYCGPNPRSIAIGGLFEYTADGIVLDATEYRYSDDIVRDYPFDLVALHFGQDAQRILSESNIGKLRFRSLSDIALRDTEMDTYWAGEAEFDLPE